MNWGTAGSMWSLPILEDGNEQAIRYGVVPGWAGVLIGSQSTSKRYLRQAEVIRSDITKHWRLEAPWAWQRKHVAWFLEHCLDRHSEATRYYYLLTVRLLARRLGKPWVFKLGPTEMHG